MLSSISDKLLAEAPACGARALSLGAQHEGLLTVDNSHSNQWIGQAFQALPHKTQCTRRDVDKELEACSSDLTSVRHTHCN